MSWEPARTIDHVAELRHLFDSAFSRIPPTDDAQIEDVLAIRVGQEPYAVRLTEISGLAADKAITRLPSPVPALLGIASFRGTIASVYDLRALLGHGGGEPPRWLVLTATDATVGLAFDQFEGHLRVPREAIAVEERAGPSPARAQEVVRVAGVVRPIVDVPSILDTIKKQVRDGTAYKER